ncbi:MAG: DUF3450 family protein [Lentisphaeria bacterium]|nr:DUF3450 family protein [Lentisphaeria bacterium]
MMSNRQGGARRAALVAGAVLALTAGTGRGAEAEDLRRLQQLVGEEIALRRAAHEARAEWAGQKPALDAHIALLGRQAEEMRAACEQARARAAEAGERRRAAETELRQRQAARDALAVPVAVAEDRLRALLPILPQPLLDRLRENVEALTRPTAGPTGEEVPERLRLVFGLLTEIEQFAAGVHLCRLRLDDPGGRTREMDVLYLGLANAYAVATEGDEAAFGVPGASGWQWRWDPSLAESVRAAVAVFRKERPAAFLRLPLERAGVPGEGVP